MNTTTTESIASCISYANSTKAAVGFAVMVTEGDSLRNDIKAGKYEGVSFPEPKQRKKRKTYSNAQKIAKMEEINGLRDAGAKKTQACTDAGINSRMYEKWSVDLGIKYTEKPVDAYPYDLPIASLVRGGESVESACAKFGLKSEAWRYRAIKKGLYKSNGSRIRPIEYYADGVARVKAFVRKHGCTAREACKQVGFAEYNYRRHKLLSQ